MIKFLFFDYRELEWVRGFTRQLEQPIKHPDNPLLVADALWENGNMQLYGSVIKVEDKPFQMWYSVIHRPWKIYLAYAESEDGIVWRKPLFDTFKYKGEKTNIVFTDNPHGSAVIYDTAEQREDWRYKMVAGTDPSGCICAYRGPDGIHWYAVRRFPVIGTNPDCPMGFLRAPDGRYVIYHRLHGFGRRIFRSKSWDFKYWTSEPKMIMEPDAGDPPQMELYGMGSAPYGTYEIGTLWIYHTDPEDYHRSKMHGYQEAELTYARSGYTWHRAAQGVPFISRGYKGSWEQGNLQCASAPVYLDNEIRYYYAGTNMFHKVHWELEPQRAGLGMASIKPDRFVALEVGDEIAELMTVSFKLLSRKIFVNACTEENGWVRVEILDINAKLIRGFAETECDPITGDSISHAVHWRGANQNAIPIGKSIRLRLRAHNARVYSIYSIESGKTSIYHRFSAARL